MMRFLDPRLTVGFLSLFFLIDPASAQENWAAKMFHKQSHDFGHVARGTNVEFKFQVRNLYKETVHISNIRTSCSCASAKATKDTLVSLERGEIVVTIDTVRHSRQRNPNLIVTFDQPFYKEVSIPLSVYIRTDIVMQPGSVNFGATELGSEETRKMSIAYAGRSNWTIQNVESKNDYLNAEFKEVSRGNGLVNYELVVTLKADAPIGTLRDTVTLVTDDTNSPRIPILVEAKVEPDILVTPSPLTLGQLQPGKETRFNIVLRGKKPFAIEKIECDSASDAFKVALPENAPMKNVHVIPMSVTPPDTPGDFSEAFTVTIPGRPEPVTFVAYGKIMAQN